MSPALISRQQLAATASTSGRSAAATVALPRPAGFRAPRLAPGFGPSLPQSRLNVRANAKPDERKNESGPTPNEPTSTEREVISPFFEPLLRGLVLGVGAGIIMELLHVAIKVTDISTDGGFHLPSAAQIYEQLSPLFVWDHAVAITFWIVFYAIEAVAILAILREYPDDKQASKVIKSTPTLPKRLLPWKLGKLRTQLHALLTGKALQGARQGAAPMAYRGGAGATLERPRTTPSSSGSSAAGTAVLERPRPAAEPPKPSASTSAPTAEPKAKPAPKPAPKEGCSDDAGCSGQVRGGSLNASLRKAAGLRPGQLDPGSPLLGGKTGVSPKESLSSKREKELADRKAYLQNFWYAAAISDKVTSKPTKVDILSRTVTIWRGEDGQVHCLDNVCPHRGAPLSNGWTKSKGGKSCVVCPYHGWAFNGEGSLEEVPSQNADVAFPKRPLVNSYPVEERGGFVWLFFGAKGLPAAERPPIPVVPELEDPNWRAVYGEMEFDCPHWSVFENALDMAHIHYLHDGSFGNQDKPVINDMKVTRDTWGVQANFHIHNKPVSPLWNWTAVPAVPVEARAMLPSTSYVKITLAGGVQMITFVNTVPIDEHRAINRFCLIRNFALNPIFDGYTRKSMIKILGEDKAMIELLKPEQLLNEVSLEADKPQIAFRKLRQEWIDMGYGVQPDTTAKHSGSLKVDL